MKEIMKNSTLLRRRFVAAAMLSLMIITAVAQNYISTARYNPDPAPVVSGDRLYVFTGHDLDTATYFRMPDWQLFSTTDMKHWKDHGIVMSTAVFKWAKQGDNAWASQAIERNGKWYWYVAAEDTVKHLHGVGVAVADKPDGPWTDPIGKPLIPGDWGFIDPSVFIDDDGQAYLFWGNNGCWYAKLNEDMISIDMSFGISGKGYKRLELEDTAQFGPLVEKYDYQLHKRIPKTNFEEAPWIYKIGDTYFLEYAAGGVPEFWAYSTSKSIHGPWKYEGAITGNSPGAFTIHGGTIDFKGKSYLFYHDGIRSKGNGFRRTAAFVEFQRKADGRIPFIELPSRGDDREGLGKTTLLNGPLKRACDLNVKTLMQYDCDRLLAPFLKEAGLTPKAKSYPNWDGLDGHVGGHYITALAINAANGDEQCLQRLNYCIDQLADCAAANAKNHAEWGRGYVGGVPNSANIWSTFRRGDFAAFRAAWVPFYNLHKAYAGLRDAWMYCGNEKAKTLFLGFCDWAVNITAELNDAQMEQVLDIEHGGMNEVLADAYAFTGQQKYLDCARRFSHKRLLRPMLQHLDVLDNMHANTQVPKVVGFERIAQLAGDEVYHEASQYFWDIVTSERTIALGGNSRREHFPAADACMDFINDVEGPETCNTNNMLKLSMLLHQRSPQARYADFMEAATFNHILSSQHPVHGGYVYFTPARPRHYRNYSAPNEAMWCCVGTGMENHGKYGEFVYTTKGDAIYVNLFVASEYKDNGVTLRQETGFPYAETSKITIAEGKGQFPLMVRYPGWVRPGEFTVKVNGKAVDVVSGPSSYVSIDRKWKKGDCVEITFPMHAYLKYLPNNPQYVALMYGPVLLSMKTGTEDLARLVSDDSRFGQIACGKKLPIDKAPILINSDINDIANQINPIPGKPLHFTLSTKMINAIDGELQPFFEVHDSRYMMYWLALTPDSYTSYVERLAQEEADRQALDARTIDKVQPGEQQPESDHFMITDESAVGNAENCSCRDASNGHFFSYLMTTNGETELSLRLKYWGIGEWKSHEFDIFVDDVLVQSVNNTGKYRVAEFKYETYPLPEEVLKGKKQVRIKFQAAEGKQIGDIYEVRLVK